MGRRTLMQSAGWSKDDVLSGFSVCHPKTAGEISSFLPSRPTARCPLVTCEESAVTK